MNRLVAAAFSLAVSALLLAACGNPHPTATAVTPSPASSPPSATSASPSRSVSATGAAEANARTVADAFASGSASQMSSAASAVSGPVMETWVRTQVLMDEAYSAEGEGDQAASVTEIPGGYQLCLSGTCVSATEFHSDASGRITDFFTDGGLVSHRLAVGADSTGSGLEISDVASIASLSDGILLVAFEVHDITWTTTAPGSGLPFIPRYVTSDGSPFEYDPSHSVMPSSLQPGQSVAVLVVFDTVKNTGQFSLTENGPGNTIVSTTLHPLSTV